MKRFWLLIPLTLLCFGCTTSLDNYGEVGFKQATTWSFYHLAEVRNGEANAKSQVSIDEAVLGLIDGQNEVPKVDTDEETGEGVGGVTPIDDP